MERVFTELRDAYVNSASGQKSCMVCLASIKDTRRIIDSGLSLRKIFESLRVHSPQLCCVTNFSEK